MERRIIVKLIRIGAVHLLKLVDWLNDVCVVILMIVVLPMIIWFGSALSWIRRFSHVNVLRQPIFVLLRFKFNHWYLFFDGQGLDCVLIINVGVRKIAVRVLIFNGSSIWKCWHVILRKINCVSSGIKSLKDRIGLKQPDNCKSNLKGSEKEN
jgi:hypothetical protein